MSAIQPSPFVPVVDTNTGLMKPEWFEFLMALSKLPRARLSGEVAYDPPNLAAGATTTQAVTVSGATLGWEASAAFSGSLSGLVMSAYVSAANTVTAVLYNPTAGAIDLAAGTLTGFAWRP